MLQRQFTYYRPLLWGRDWISIGAYYRDIYIAKGTRTKGWVFGKSGSSVIDGKGIFNWMKVIEGMVQYLDYMAKVNNASRPSNPFLHMFI